MFFAVRKIVLIFQKNYKSISDADRSDYKSNINLADYFI